MENVPELARSEVFTDFKQTLDQLNYFTWHRVVDCQSYGVPQARRRLILVGSKFGPISLKQFEGKQKSVRDTIKKLDPVFA